MYILDESVLQPGDIVLTTQDRKVSKGIRRLTGSTFSHAILYVARGGYIHSDVNGVQSNNTQRLLFSGPGHALALRLARETDKKKIQLICDYARAQVGTQYSVSEAIASRKKRGAAVGLRSNRQFCSRLVAQSYAYGGVALVPNPDYCYPTDLYKVDLVAHVPKCLRVATAAEIEFANTPSPLEVQAQATNYVLEGVRKASGEDVQTEEQVVQLLLRRPDLDEASSRCLMESGYLELWRMEVTANPWRYEDDAFGSANPPPEIRAEEISSAEDLLRRFTIMRTQFSALGKRRTLKYFALKRDLYERLIAQQVKRRQLMRGGDA
ncbi:MAG: YiiX/YebB-like N1pC/P60 family cysteine hydrolase [Polaromonas sp.]|nr:YiiX/YebB-like N1pC/P60 family cysteine hydrolase [Polaromonas sp.]